ncbi:hypothetical protein GF343_03760 [Candidatus Woesearchaeota archaeon]|nr:hypothetical protein [Candidatus Woesearchaeota archaeon]
MVRHSAITFLFVSVVAIFGLSLFFDAVNTGSVISKRDCAGYAYEHDIIFKDIIFRAQGKEGYYRDSVTLFDPCVNKEVNATFEAFVQSPPLLGYGRFMLAPGSVFAFQGAPEPGKGSIMYWICPPDETGFQRARLVMYDKEVCNTFGDTFVFEDAVTQRGTL